MNKSPIGKRPLAERKWTIEVQWSTPAVASRYTAPADQQQRRINLFMCMLILTTIGLAIHRDDMRWPQRWLQAKRCIVLQTAFNGNGSQHVDMVLLIMASTNPSIVCRCLSYVFFVCTSTYNQTKAPPPPFLEILKPSSPKQPRLP